MSIRDEIRSQLDPDLVIRPIPEEVRQEALEGIPELLALHEEILASRGGRPISNEELIGTLDKRSAMQEPQKEERQISLEEIVAALHEARAAHERGE